MKEKRPRMLPPYRPQQRPSRLTDGETSDVPQVTTDAVTDPHGRLILKSPLRVLDPPVRRAKLTVIK